MVSAKQEYISLREAAKLSGYTSDYVGQLIRSGKLPGKQVFSHVEWMTTEEALQEYTQKKRGSGKNQQTWKESVSAAIKALSARIRCEMEMPKLLTKVTYVIVALSLCFFLLLFYIFSTSLEREINQKAIERAEATRTSL